MNYILVKDDIIIGASQVPIIDEGVQLFNVDDELFNKYIADNNSIIFDVETHTLIDNPDYEELKARQREEEFNKEFFHISAGYIRRKAQMKDGSLKDFITDLVPLMVGTNNIPIIVYAKPDFTKEVTEEDLIGLQSVVMSTPELIDECKAQAIIDFYGYNPLELLQQQEIVEPAEEPVIEPSEELDNIEE